MANLKRQVLVTKKIALQKQPQIFSTANPTTPIERPVINPNKRKRSNFGLIYKYKSEKSYLVRLIRGYCLVDIQYIYSIKKNKFNPKNIMKLSNSISRTKSKTKHLQIRTGGFKMKAKEEDYTTPDAKDIIPLLWNFHLYTQILVFLATTKDQTTISISP